MDRLFQHKDGSLFIKMDHIHLRGVFRLQLVSPLTCTVDLNWFEDELNKSEINELRTFIEDSPGKSNNEPLIVDHE